MQDKARQVFAQELNYSSQIKSAKKVGGGFFNPATDSYTSINYI